MRIFSFVIISLFLLNCKAPQKITAQDKPTNSSLEQITLEDIWQKGTFRSKRLNAFRSMQGDFYTLLQYHYETNSTSIDKYSYQTTEKLETLVDSKELDEVKVIGTYAFNADETKLLLSTESEPIYRRSFLANFYVYDLQTKRLQKVANTKIQQASFSPDSRKVSYVFENNIYYKDLIENSTTQVTFDGKINEIINGVTDWVYEEEFGFVRAFSWNVDGTALAFLRFDETDVPEFTMMRYGKDLYPHPHTFKYPKAGEKNSEVSLHLYTLGAKSATKIELGDYEYIPRFKWTKDADILSVQTTNRRQNSLKLHFVYRNSQKAKLILNESSDTYVNVRDVLTFLNDNSFIWPSERDGYEHLYHFTADGKLQNQITKGNWDVTKFYGVDENAKSVFYQSHENGSINRTVYSVDLSGRNKKLLSPDFGANSASFSKNKKYYINNFSDSQTPSIYTLHKSDGTLLKEMQNNKALQEKLREYNVGKREFSTITTKDGTFNMWMIKPLDFDSSKEHPVLMYQYSGPGSQSVQNSWNGYDEYWYYMLASKGYITVCVDGRGTGGKGTAFTKQTYKELGKYETIDQIEAAKELGKLPYIDTSRIGIWGWSYGAFTSANAILKGADTFKMAIAVAPVTNWRLYDSVYTERYMQTPQENPDGYDKNSPLFFADQLKGKLLLVHGTGDDNVHVQNSIQLMNALIKADVPFDSEFYPDRTHSIYRGENTRLHLYKKMTDYIEENL